VVYKVGVIGSSNVNVSISYNGRDKNWSIIGCLRYTAKVHMGHNRDTHFATSMPSTLQ